MIRKQNNIQGLTLVFESYASIDYTEITLIKQKADGNSCSCHYDIVNNWKHVEYILYGLMEVNWEVFILMINALFVSINQLCYESLLTDVWLLQHALDSGIYFSQTRRNHFTQFRNIIKKF